MLVFVFFVVLKSVVVVGGQHGFAAVIVLRHHVQGNDVHQAIIVKIHNFIAHRRVRSMFKVLAGAIGEGPILVVDVQVVIRHVVIADVNIFPAIAVEVHDVDGQAKSFPLDARFQGYFSEYSVFLDKVPIIAIKPIMVVR